MSLIIYNICKLVHTEQTPVLLRRGEEMSVLNCVDNAYIWIKEGLIHDFGTYSPQVQATIRNISPDIDELDAGNGMVFPSWVDAHTHMVYAGSREGEFVGRINGLSYEEIAARGGGILNSAKRLQSASEEELLESALLRLDEIIRLGTGAVEIKSGYGLSVESELKMLRVIRRLKEISPIDIKSTFLGAHAVPEEYKNNKSAYIDLLISELMPRIQNEGLADFCDVFCERNYFSKEETIRIMEAAKLNGMQPKIHAEQLSHSGGIEAGVQCGAISVDHLEFASENDLRLLKDSNTIPVLLPGAQLFLGLRNPPAREMIRAGLPVALSSDFNPGSCPSGNMNQMVSLACILYKMSPEEAINAATLNSAAAIGLSETLGSIAKGKKANLFITPPIPSYAFLPYYFGQSLIKTVVLNGMIHSFDQSSE
ncbi:MAG TPA: imidazolonepropionase [Bacteroidia bacterium]|nr:imidazolonepropionase [Bacteroidia bacterium]